MDLKFLSFESFHEQLHFRNGLLQGREYFQQVPTFQHSISRWTNSALSVVLLVSVCLGAESTRWKLYVYCFQFSPVPFCPSLPRLQEAAKAESCLYWKPNDLRGNREHGEQTFYSKWDWIACLATLMKRFDRFISSFKYPNFPKNISKPMFMWVPDEYNYVLASTALVPLKSRFFCCIILSQHWVDPPWSTERDERTEVFVQAKVFQINAFHIYRLKRKKKEEGAHKRTRR